MDESTARGVERPPPAARGGPEAEIRALQQEVVAHLGLSAIVASGLQEVLDETVGAAADTLGVDLAEVFQLEPDGENLLLRAARGLRSALVGAARVPVGRARGGYTIRVPEPVVTADLAPDGPHPGPRLLADHGAVAGITVVIRTKNGPWGILGVHSTEPREFTRDDVHFLQAVANVVTAVLERERVEDQLRRSRAELALRVAEERLRRSERLASLGTLAAGIAHEINNPVNTILMTAETSLMALEAGHPGDRLARDLGIVVREAERCGQIVRKVLEFVRERKPERERADLNEVVRSAVTMARKTLRDTGPGIETELAGDLPPVQINPAEMEQAIIHLVRNALEAGDGEAVSVVVRTYLNESGVVVEVEDEGVGIAPEIRDRVFDPFFTTRRDRGGTGLGLALAHSIVTDHGGTIDLDTAPHRGSVFRVELPGFFGSP